MRANNHLYWLVSTSFLVMAVPAAIAYYVSSPWGQELLLTISGTSFSVLVAVLVVDRIYESMERQRWFVVERIVLERVSRVATRVNTSFRTAFQIPLQDSDVASLRDEDRNARIEFVRRLMEQQIRPLVVASIPTLSPSAWQTLYANVYGAYAENEQILAAFGPRIEPSVQERILALSEELMALLNVMTWLRDVLGVPECERSANSKYTPAEETRVANSLAIGRVFALLEAMDAALIAVRDR